MCFYDWTSASANIPHICTKVHIPIPKLQTFRVQVGRPCASPPSSKEVRVLYFAAQKTGASKGYVFGGYLDRLFVNLVSFCFLIILVSFGLLFLWTSFGKISKLKNISLGPWMSSIGPRGVLLLPVATTALWPLVSRCESCESSDTRVVKMGEFSRCDSTIFVSWQFFCWKIWWLYFWYFVLKTPTSSMW